jgi:hypothetical protein
MASFIRHVGKHGDRKVAVVFREVPGEDHMCLVVYTELLGQQIHDPLMKCIESDIGQQSDSLADALNRSYTTTGAPILQTLHSEGKLKKVQTDLITMTPAPNTSIKLNELNKILNEMKLGEDAVKKLADMDKSLGMQTKVAKKMRGDKVVETKAPAKAAKAPVAPQRVVATTNEVLGDTSIAQNLLNQATKMEREARGLLAEAKRLTDEAKALDPSINTADAAIAAAKPTSRKEAKAIKVAKIAAAASKAQPKKARVKETVA